MEPSTKEYGVWRGGNGPDTLVFGQGLAVARKLK